MAKRTTKAPQLILPDVDASGSIIARRRRALILPRKLADLAAGVSYFGGIVETARDVLRRWADLESAGALQRKERSLDAEFLHEVFGKALRYATATEKPESYQLEREYGVPGVGTADGALGHFAPGDTGEPLAVIELKGADANLDRDRFNGRTAVQQCWDYLNALPGCPWGIVSNFKTIRLYHRDRTPLAWEEFTLQDLRKEERFLQFLCVFEREGLIGAGPGARTRALRLVHETGERQRIVGDELYEAYRKNRLVLIDALHHRFGQSVPTAIRVAQKLLDRIIFIAFCEDRGLLPRKTIERAWNEIPPFTAEPNPRWRSFVELFRAVDHGHKRLDLSVGYNGGLFHPDPDLDGLQLGDEWADFFRAVGGYDFRHEVNVDVLGHLFEKSVTELEKLRAGGLFDTANGEIETVSKMPKSAQRKRFGIYYTPAELTEFIVRNTIEPLIDERFAELARRRGVDPETDEPGETLRLHWRDALEALRALKVCDPACGSGAFLIQAYDLLEERYGKVVDELHRCGDAEARRLAENLPRIILRDNLYGVDLSPEAVEITQLALWIRSAQPDRTLADLSKNIVCGNSLIDDAEIHDLALVWAAAFPEVFTGDAGGFDCVVGNPPWERLKVQEREFFSFSAPKIAGAVHAATRRKLIATMELDEPALHARYLEARAKAERNLNHARKSGRFPLTGRGDVNNYALFAELAMSIVAPTGRVGLLVPSGIASDHTTRGFFNRLMESKRLIAIYDFENRKGLFPDVHRSFKFCVLAFGGTERRTEAADFAFFTHGMRDLADRDRRIALSAPDIALVNPNTRTCPIFRTRRDAELTKGIYRRVPILIDRNREAGGNPWGVRFVRMFDQTNDAELFREPQALADAGCTLRGNVWTRRKERYLPVYEAKMIQAFDHRAAGVVIEEGNWVRQGQTKTTTLVEHQNPEFVPQPRYWVDEGAVFKALGATRPAYLAYKDVTSPTNERTMIAAFIPRAGVVNSAPLILTGDDISIRRTCCLLANLNSFVLDFAARQKVGNIHLNFFIVEQLPMIAPDEYERPCPWQPGETLEHWISERVLKLTCAANDMLPLAEAAGFEPGVQKWRNDERAALRAELDAAYFRLYGVSRDDAEYILSTFRGTRRRDEADTGSYRTADDVLREYDAPS